jgi:SPP1 gp7 family putative phage head morphogenesis protein
MTTRSSDRPHRPGKIERAYLSALRKIARHVSDVVRGFPPGDPSSDAEIRRILSTYAGVLDGWARVTAERFLRDMLRQDENEWFARARTMGVELGREIRSAPTGQLMQSLLREQVGLIKSIPLREAERVHELTLRAIENGSRGAEIEAEIMRSNEVTANRARLIARTETARTASKLVEARARHLGSKGYIWRSSRDGIVRESHKAMEGKYVEWDNPPTLSDGTTTHAGQIYNCRCSCEPIIPLDF